MAAEANAPQAAGLLSILIPAVAALIGALIGSLSGIVAQFMQSSSEHKRERLRLAAQLALAEHESNLTRAAAWADRGKQVRVLPVAMHLDFHKRFLDLAESGDTSPEAVQKVYDDHRKVKEVVDTMAPYFIPKRRGPAEPEDSDN